jgi:hypothetical protein
MEKKFYAVIDPCYLAVGDEWDKFGEPVEWDIENAPFPHKFSKGTVLTVEGTANGDGYWNGVAVDSGTLCIAEIDPLTPLPVNGYRVFQNESVARRFLAKACAHI